jgi:hypothetical protein
MASNYGESANSTGYDPNDDPESISGPIGEPNSGRVTLELEREPGSDEGNKRDSNGTSWRFDTGTTAGSDIYEQPKEEANLPPPSRVKGKAKGTSSTPDAGVALAGLITLTSALLAQRLGDIWMVSDEEARQLGRATIKVIEHIPGSLIPTEQLGVGIDCIALAGAFGAVFGTRYLAWRKMRALGISDADLAAAVARQTNAQANANRNGTNPAGSVYPDGLEVPE